MMRDDSMPPKEPVSPVTLAAMVRALREARQWTQETLAEISRLTTRTVQRVEGAEPSSPETRRALARAFEMKDLDAFNGDPMAELERVVGGAAEELRDELDDLRARLSEYICPHCGAPLSGRNEAPIDPEQRHWDLVESYECGFQTFAGDIIYPCPSDPQFPTLDDYDVVCERQGLGTEWVCCALPKTDMARKVRLQECQGKSAVVVHKLMKAMYLYRAGYITNAEWWRLQAEISKAG